jgi:hypothetical protein
MARVHGPKRNGHVRYNAWVPPRTKRDDKGHEIFTEQHAKCDTNQRHCAADNKPLNDRLSLLR